MKLVLGLLAACCLFALLFPRSLPRLLRRLGRGLGDLGRAGRELATGEEVERSPLARYEVRAGELVLLKVLTEYPRCADQELQRRVAEVGGRLAAHATRKGIPYRFAAVEAREPNAFAVPGGAIFVTRPLLDLCGEDQDSIAGVLAHEIIHVDRRHAVATLASTLAVETGVRILSLGRAALPARLAAGMKQLLVQGYRQDHELEADLAGVRLARGAGFDPRGLVDLLERIGSQGREGEGPLEKLCQYFKSHPPIAERVARLRRELGT